MRRRMMFLFLLAIPFALFANEEMVMVKKSDLPINLQQKIAIQQTAANVQQGVQAAKDVTQAARGIGDEIGTAVDKSLGAITKHTAELGETKVGKFTMFMVAWKVMYKDVLETVKELDVLWRVPFGILLFIVIFSFTWWSYKNTCIPRTIPTKEHVVYGDDGKKIKSIDREFETINSDEGGRNDYPSVGRVFHAFFIIIVLIGVSITVGTCHM